MGTPKLQLLGNVGGTSTYVGPEKPEDSKYTLWVDTSIAPAVVKYKNANGEWVMTAGNTGGNATGLEVINLTGWLYKTISHGVDCELSLSWSSIRDGIDTGKGIVKVIVNGVVKTAREVAQGTIPPVNVGNYLISGTNTVELEVLDIYGDSKKIIYTIEAVSLNLTSYFDATVPHSGDITFSYTPTGAIEKTVHFIVDRNELKDTPVVTVSGREQSYTIPAQKHGSHTLEVYFTGKIDGENVESNHLLYDLICYEEGNETPIIATSFKAETVNQYSTVVIPYIVYTPLLTADIQLKDNGKVIRTETVNRTLQKWAYKASTYGTKNLAIVCGDVVKEISFEVTETKINVSAETNNLERYLTSENRSNTDIQNRLLWRHGDVNAELTKFNFISDGWQPDDDGNTVLRVSGDARVYIPFEIFKTDFKTSGKTIEIEFATRDVLNYDAVVLSSWSESNRGIRITAQKALFKSEQSEIFTQYKEDEHVRVTFCVEKRVENRLLSIYINGIMSGVIQYPDGDDFSFPDTTPVGIAIGSNECTTDIYCIRVYGNNLSRYQVLDNWIADTQDYETLMDRYTRNDIFDDYGNISISKLPQNLPYLVVNAASYSDLPQKKPDEKIVSGFYVDPLNSERSFTFEGAEIDVQGTSSATYPRKNYKIKFKGGFVVNGETQPTYKLRPTSMPTDVFTFKADVASSEGANNVELVMFYEDTCPVKTPPQVTDSRVRQGIEGYPCLMFYYDGTNYNFLGKYNFNNDKATEEVFGFEEGDESWEIRQNNTNMVIWKDDNFEGDAWKASFEARYPDKSEDVTNLQALSSWLKSTDTTAVDTEEEKAERLAKFKNEFENWFNKDALIFNYIFTELFLMMDNRAKNAFPTRYDEDGKWVILPYDYDSAIGINNMGELKYGYHLEDTDIVGTHPVFNGQDSVLYVNIRLAFADEIRTMYQNLRKTNMFSYKEIEKRFENHQSVWGEAIFNEDARFKYIEPLIQTGSTAYLSMLQGSKAEQRKWWLYNRFRYLDAKYVAGDSQEDYIKIRPCAVADIEVTPYADIYASAMFDSIMVGGRALRAKDEEGNDQSYTLKNPLAAGKEADVLIYSASQLLDIGDLSGLKVEWADFSMGTKLSSLKIGSGESGYENPNLTNLTVGVLTMLRTLDVRNCSGLTQAVDVSGCTNIENVYLEGTATTGAVLPNGGILKTLHLPSTVTNLTICNQPFLTDFVLPTYENISTLRLEGVNQRMFDTLAILDQIKANARVRILGVNWNIATSEEIFALYDKLDTFRGLDENDNTLDNAVISGTININSIKSTDLQEMKRRYPNINIEYDNITLTVEYVNDGVTIFSQEVKVGERVPTISNPTKESTAQYHFTFLGWSLDGKTVTTILPLMPNNGLRYIALYSEELRYYTVRFLDETGVLETHSVAYGSDATYTGDVPAKTDYTFTGWRPAPTNIVGDTDCYAQFKYASSITRGLLTGKLSEISNSEVTSVRQFAFVGLPSVTSIDLPNATSIGYGAFNSCPALKSVNLPNVISLGNHAFYSSELTSIDLPNATSIGDSAFYTSRRLTSANMPNATSIGRYAFFICESLTSVNISNVSSIAQNAFEGCKSLTSVYLPASPPSIQSSVFSGINSNCVFYIPSGCTAAYQGNSSWSTLMNSYSFIEGGI